MHRDPAPGQAAPGAKDPCAAAEALHPVIKRGSEWYQRLKRKRQSIERVFSRLKNHFNLDNLKVKGLAKVKPHVLLSLTSMLVYALTAAKRGFESLVRSPTRLTA